MSKTNLELATEIVIAMLNNNLVEKDENSNRITSETVCSALEKVVNKLDELQGIPANVDYYNDTHSDDPII